MATPPRIVLVPLAVLVSIVPFTFSSFVGRAGADTVSDCEAAFSSPSAAGLTSTTDPVERLAWTGQTVHLSAAWDPSAWDSLSSAGACVRLDDDAIDETLGTVQEAPANTGAFDHSFAIPEVDAGTRLCTRIRLAGEPAGDATEAVWVSKEHCYEVDHEVAEEETPPPDTTASTTTTSTTVPVAAPADSSSVPGGDTPAVESPETPAPVTPQGGGGPVDTPFDTAGAPAPDLGGPHGPVATTPDVAALLPATGYASMSLLRKGELFLFSGLGLLVLFGLPRRRRMAVRSGG
jgi:hypothetical protein